MTIQRLPGQGLERTDRRYYVMNKFNPKQSSVVRTFDEAQAAEHDGASPPYTGKVLEYTALAVLVVAIVGIVVLAAAAQAQQQQQAPQQQQAQRPLIVEQRRPTVTTCHPNLAGGFDCFSY